MGVFFTTSSRTHFAPSGARNSTNRGCVLRAFQFTKRHRLNVYLNVIIERVGGTRFMEKRAEK